MTKKSLKIVPKKELPIERFGYFDLPANCECTFITQGFD